MLKAWFVGLNFKPVSGLTLADGDNLTQNIRAATNANGSVSGHISFTATSGSVVDVTLLHPGSREVLSASETLDGLFRVANP